MKRFYAYLTALVLLVVLGTSNMFATAPTVQARYVNVPVAYLTANSARITWTNGSGNGRIVLMKQGSNPVVPDADNADLDGANLDLANAYTWVADNDLLTGGFTGTRLEDVTGNVDLIAGPTYVVYSGTGTTNYVDVYGLAANTQYSFTVIEANVVSGNWATGVKDIRTSNGTLNNPRSLTTLVNPVTTPAQPTVSVLGPWATITWAQDDAGYSYKITIRDTDNSDAIVAPYDGLDIGDLGAQATETFEAFLPAGHYSVQVLAYQGNVSSSLSTARTFTVTDPVPPKFVQTVTTMTSGEMYVDVVFDKEATSNTNGTAADLDAADFQITDFAANGGTAFGVSILSVSKQNSTTYRLTLNIAQRASGAETFKVAPADNYSIFGRNGVPMDPDDYNNNGDQKSHAITSNVTTVLNGTTDFSYVTLQQAHDASTTVAGHSLILLDGGTYSDNTTITKANLTIRDDNAAADAVYTGTITFDPTGNDPASDLSINDIEFDTRGLVINAVIVNNGNLFFTNNNVKYDGVDNVIIFDEDGLHEESYIGETSGNVAGANTFTRFGTESTANVIYVDEGNNFNAAITLKVVNNTFAVNAGAGNAGDKAVYLFTNNAGLATALVISNNIFQTDLLGDAIYFAKGSTGTNNIFNDAMVQDNEFSNTGKAIAFEADEDFTTELPVIDLGTGGTANDFGVNCTGVTTKYVYSGADLATSEFLYPGIAVLKTDADGDLTTTTNAQAYNTVNAAITASANDATQTVYLGEGVYSETIALNEAVDLVGKGAAAEAGNVYTQLTNVLTINETADNATVSFMAFDAQNTNSIVIAGTPDAHTLAISDVSFDYQNGDIAINVTDPTIAGTLTIAATSGSNSFAKSMAVNGGTATGTAIALLDNQITGTVNIYSNNFAFNSTGVDKGIVISSTNSTGVSNGTISITGNTFAPNSGDGDYNGVGDAIVFADLFDNTANPTYNLSTGNINIYNQNDFRNVGYAVKIDEQATPAAAIYTTLPTIDLFDVNSAPEDAVNANFTAGDIYGAAWYTLIAQNDATDILYPSIQAAENACNTVATLEIGKGTYKEDVTFDDAQLTTLHGNGSTCELDDTKTATLSVDLTTIGGFLATNVVLGADAAKLDDAITLVKTTTGIIEIPIGRTITGDATLNKAGVAITGDASVPYAMGGTYSGTLTVTDADNASISHIAFNNADNSIYLNPTTSLSTINIGSNTFVNDNASAIAIKTNSGKSYTDLFFNSNTFNFGTTADRAQTGIKLDRSNYNGTIVVANNILTMEGGSAVSVAGSDIGVLVEASSAALNATPGTLNIYGNTFDGDANINNSTIGVLFRNTVAAAATNDNFANIYINDGNMFTNDGYSIYSVNENAICDNLPASISLTNSSPNSYLVGANELATNHYRGFQKVADITLATELTPSCAPATMVETGTHRTDYGFASATDNSTFIVTFSEPVYTNADGSGALTTSDFAATCEDGTGVAVTGVTTSDDQTFTLTLTFDARMAGGSAETVTIAPATNSSIYNFAGTATPTTENTPDDPATATVLVDAGNDGVGTNYSFVTIAQAYDYASAGDGIILKDETTYTEDLTVTENNITIKDDNIATGNAATNATLTGTITSDPGAGNSIFIRGITLNSQGAPTSAVIVSSGDIYLTTCRVNYDGGDKAVYLPSGVTHGHVNIGTLVDNLNSGTNDFRRYGTTGSASAIYVEEGNVFTALRLSNNLFSIVDAGNTSDEVIALYTNNGSTAAPLTITNINSFSCKGNTVTFKKGSTGSNSMFSTVTISGNQFSLAATAIAFESGQDFSSILPVISLGGGNTNVDGTTSITTKYVYSHSTLDLSSYLYPGIAVLKTNADGTLTTTTNAQAYNSIASAIAASANNGSQTVYLGVGTYADNVVLNEAVSLVGKDKLTTIIAPTTGVAMDFTTTLTESVNVQHLQLAPEADNCIVIANVNPMATTKTLTFDNLKIIPPSDKFVADIYNAFAGPVTFAGNLTFSNCVIDETLGTNAGQWGIHFNGGAWTGNRTFQGNTFTLESDVATATIDKAVVINTENSVANSSGAITFTGNTFTGGGYGVLFVDGASQAATFGITGTISMFNENNFNQTTGYAVRFENLGNLLSTLPLSIDLYDAGTAGHEANLNFTAADIFGAAWYDLTSDNATAFLYPSIQDAQDNCNTITTLNIGEGSYKEDVIFNDADLLTITGQPTVTCEIFSSNKATLSKDLAISNFLSTRVDLDNIAANLADANDLVKDQGTINVVIDGTLAGNATITKRCTIDGDVTLGGHTAGTKALYNGVISVSVTGANTTTIKNFNWTGQDEANNILFSASSSNVNITDNTFETAVGGSAVASAGSISLTSVNVGTSGHGNTFNFGAGATTVENGIYLPSTKLLTTTIAYNTFNFDGGSADTWAGRDYAIKLQVDNATAGTDGITINNNNFAGGVDLSNSTAALAIYDGDLTWGYLANPTLNSNTFANDGYAVVFNNNGGDFSLCTYLNGVTLGTGGNVNTFTLGANNLVANPVIGGYYTPLPIDGTTTTIYTDCTPPQANAGDFLYLTAVEGHNPNEVEGWINSTYVDGVNLTIELTNTPDKDASLVYGTLQLQTMVSTDGAFDGETWSNYGTPVTITDEMLNTDGYYNFNLTYAELVGAGPAYTSGLLDATGDKIKFRAIINDMAGNSRDGAESGEWTRDIAPPALVITNPSLDGQRMVTFSLAVGTKDNETYSSFKFSARNTTSNDWWDENAYTFTGGSQAWFDINSWSGTDWTYSFDPSATANYSLWVTATDEAGNTTTVTRPFVIDNTPPVITSLTRTDDQSLVVTFNEAVESIKANRAANYTFTGTVNGSSFTTSPTTATRGANIGVNDNVVTLAFPAGTFTNMIECETITLTINNLIPNGVRDIAGNLLNSSARGATADGTENSGLNYNQAKYRKPDLTAPAVSGIVKNTPAGQGVHNASVTSATYRVTFSEDVHNAGTADFTVAAVTGSATTSVASVTGVAPNTSKVYDVVVNVSNAANGTELRLDVDGASDIKDIKCQVGGTDAALSNIPYSGGQTYTFDQTKPTLVSATPNLTSVAEANIGDAAFTVTLVFNEAMDQTTAPTIAFTTDPVTGGTLALDLTSGWSNATTYIARYDVADLNTDFVDVDITVSGAKDAALNTMDADATNIDEFDIDMNKPTVTGIALNHTLLNETNVGASAFTVTATFNETMAATVPTIAFNGNPIAGGTLTLVGGTWTNPTNYRWTYTVADFNYDVADIDITISGAQDVALNTMDLDNTHGADILDIDMVDPVLSSITIFSDNTNTAYAKNGNKVTLTFTSSETLDATSSATIGTRTATISVESGLNYKAEYTIPANEADLAQGVLPFVITAKDLAGNTAADETAVDDVSSVTYDRTSPTLTLTSFLSNNATNTKAKNGDAITLTFTSNEELTLGNIGAIYQISGRTGTPAGTGPYTVSYTIPSDEATLAEGELGYSVTAYDLAGNSQTLIDATGGVIYDRTAPHVTSVVNSVATIKPGALTQTVQVNYDEEMKASTAPVISFNVGTWTYNNDGAWSAIGPNSNRRWTATYTITDNTTESVTAQSYVSGGTAADLASNAGPTGLTVNSSNFVIDVKPPQIVTLTPADDATSVVPPSALTMNFHENVTKAGLGAGKMISLYETAGDVLVAQATVSNISITNSQATITFPSFTYNCATNYYVRVDAGTFSDANSNTFTGITNSTTWNFATSAAPIAKALTAVANPICYNNTASFTIANSESGVTYQLKDNSNNTLLGSSVAGDGNQITLTTSALTTNTTVLAVGTRYGCETAMSNTVAVNVTQLPTAPSQANTDRNNFCSDDAGNIQLSVTGGSGDDVNWSLTDFGTSIGTGSPLTIASPTTTTTYYARWENPCGESSTASVTVTVNQTPDATISAGSATAFCAGNSVVLTAAELGATSYNWYETAAPGTSLGTSRTYTATTTGNYKVTVVKNGCTATTSSATTVTVTPLPDASISAGGATTFCAGNNVVLTAAEVGATSYNWFETSTPGTSLGTSRTFTATSTGNYKVTVLNNGCTSTTSSATAVTVNPLPNSSISANGPLGFCSGGSVILSAAENGATSYNWFETADPGTSLGTNQSLTVTTTGNYKVTVVKNGCTTTTATASSVSVSPLPNASISAGGATTFCAGNNVVLTAAEVGATSYNWFETAAPGTSLGTSRTYSATATGNYKVTVTNNGCSSTTGAATSVTVTPLPSASISANGPITFCAGGNVILTAAENGATSYNWFVTSAPGTSLGTNQALTVTTSGDYKVTVVKNGCTATTSTATTVTVNPLPDASISAGSATTFCSGGNVVLTAAEIGATSYNWFEIGAPGTSLGTSRTYTATTTGSYKVTVVNNGCSTTSASATSVTVNPLPDASISAGGPISFCTGGNVVLTAAEIGATSYNWFETASPGTSLGTSRTYTATTSGSYKVTVVKNGCSSTSASATSVTVNVYPSAAGAISGTTPVTAGSTGNSYSVGAIANADTYVWAYSGVGATIHGTGLSVTVDFSAGATSGNLTVKGHNNCGDGTISADFPITVNIPLAQPIITGNPSDAVNVCNGSPTSFSVAGVNGNPAPSLVWQVNMGAGFVDLTNVGVYSNVTTSTLSISNVTGLNGYVYQLKASNSQGTVYSNPATLTTSAPVTPAVSIAVTTGTNPTCAGNSVTFTATPINGGTPSYQWKVNTVNAGLNSPTFTYAPSNGDVVTVVMTTSLTCVTSATAVPTSDITMSVSQAPSTAVAGTYTLVSGLSTTLSATAPVVGTGDWTYTGPGTLTFTSTSANNAGVTASTYGTYNITWTVSNGVCTPSAETVELIFTPPPSTTFAAGSGVEPATVPSTAVAVGSSVANFDFTLTEDGTTPSNDVLPTLLNSITVHQGSANSVAIADWSAIIAGANLSDGTNNMDATSIGETSIVFSGLNITSGNLGYIADNATKTYTLKVWFKTNMASGYKTTIDGTTLDFKVTTNSFGVDGAGSGIVTGADVSSGTGSNVVDVAATQLSFVQNVTTSKLVGAIVAPNLTVEATDANGLRDLNFTGTIALSPNNTTITQGGSSVSASGFATFSSLKLGTENGTGNASLTTVNYLSLTNATTNNFSIAAAVPNSPTTLSRIGRSKNSITLGWAAVSGTNVMVIGLNGAAITVTPTTYNTSGTSFTATNSFTAATVQGLPGKILYMGNGTSVVVNNLISGQNYSFAIMSYNGSTGTWSFGNSAVILNNQFTQTKELEPGEIDGDLFSITQISPNPVSDEMRFSVNAIEAGDYTFELTNSIGQVVLTKTMYLLQGANPISIPVNIKSVLAAGKYNLRTSIGNVYVDQQVVIMP